MNKSRKFVFAVLAGTAAVLTFAALTIQSPQAGSSQAEPTSTVVIQDEGGFTTAISRVAGQLSPAVVHLDITGTVEQQVPQSPYGNDPFFRFFGPQQQREVPIQALGSGVIISPEGYIITNNHVVEHADEIMVELRDGTKKRAELVGTDPATDLAVVKVEPSSGMVYAPLGDSDQVKVGEWVIAIGSPRGFDWTVTAGIVSAKHRSGIGALGPSGYEDFIQTDASINPGNSGGPLINLKGEVIGINSVIISASRGSEGMGFAIPSNMARRISTQLIEEGRVVRGYLGVSIQDITPEMAESLDLESTSGVIVADVVQGGPADRAGLLQGDIVLRYGGGRIESAAQLRNRVASTQPGTSVEITVLRDGEEKQLSVKISDLARARETAQAQGGDGQLGMRVQKVTPQIARELGMDEPEGVVITGLAPGSPAAEAGLGRGDVVLRVNNERVNDSGEFEQQVARSAGRGSVLLLVRDAASGSTGYLTVPLDGR